MNPFTDDSITDTRPEYEQMRRVHLLQIAKSKGLDVNSTMTKAQLLTILQGADIAANWQMYFEAQQKKNGASVPSVDIEADIAAFKEDIAKAPFFSLKKLAEEYDVELPPKGDGRMEKLRSAIIEAALGG